MERYSDTQSRMVQQSHDTQAAPVTSTPRAASCKSSSGGTLVPARYNFFIELDDMRFDTLASLEQCITYNDSSEVNRSIPANPLLVTEVALR